MVWLMRRLGFFPLARVKGKKRHLGTVARPDSAEQLDRCLLSKTDHDNHFQAFNIAKSVARFSFGLTKKDDTGKVIDQFVDRIEENSSAGFCNDDPKSPCGTFDLYGVLSFIFIRQALQLHASVHLKDRKLPKLRTFAEKYLKMLPDMTRQDGLGWNYGRSVGAYGQLHCISLILQGMRDQWIAPEKNFPVSRYPSSTLPIFFRHLH